VRRFRGANGVNSSILRFCWEADEAILSSSINWGVSKRAGGKNLDDHSSKDNCEALRKKLKESVAVGGLSLPPPARAPHYQIARPRAKDDIIQLQLLHGTTGRRIPRRVT